MITSTRVLIADDYQIVRHSLRAAVQSLPGWVVCGEAENGREAVEMAQTLQPDIVVLDLGMPELNGFEATEQIKASNPDVEVLIFTGHETEETVKKLFHAGARSYILKTDGMVHFLEALKALKAHKSYFTTKVGKILFARFLKEKNSLQSDVVYE